MAQSFTCVAALVMLSLTTVVQAGPEIRPAMANFTVGEVGIADHQNHPLRVGVEYRFAPTGSWRLIPAIGAEAAVNGGRFFYTDLRHDFWLNDRWLLIPSFGAGIFDNGDDLNLRQKLEFRSGIELAYRFYKDYRAGFALFHLSNGGLSERNPGTETLVFSLCIPVQGA